MLALTLKNDGQIRLTYETLQGLLLKHLISGLDEEVPAVLGASAVATDLSGYTEWTTDEPPRVTLGWDWKMRILPGLMTLQRVGEPRSNMMLLSGARSDLGHIKSSALIEHYIDTFTWQDQALSYIASRYAFRPALMPDSGN